MASQSQQDSKDVALSELAPALDSEPVFERPSGFEHAPAADLRYSPNPHAPTGAWADSRSSFGLDAEGGPGFLDPGTFALGRHRTDLMTSIGIAGGVVESASEELGFGGVGGGDDGKGKGKGKSKGKASGSGGVSSGGDVG
jgi:hypothetical protein